MKISTRFERELEEQPALSTWMAFVRSVKAGNYKREIIKKSFKELVDPKDYSHSGMRNKIDYLSSL